MYKLWLPLIFNLNCLVKSYVNVAFNRPAWQHYPFLNRPWGAEHAVDGLYSNLSTPGGQCVISSDYRSTAEWRVDMGQVLSIHHIFIQYRTENFVWDSHNSYTSRFLGFSVYISNTTHKGDGKLCFKDTYYTKATIPNPTNITCTSHGRYVIYYNNRTNYPIPVGYSQFAFNELCEVEVYGCPTPGHYGVDCSLPCPQNCQDRHCDIVDGTCLGCVEGYKGPKCNEQCSHKMYGLECLHICGNCKNNEPCHHVHGSCLNGCDSGWYGGVKCDQICNNNTYGSNCSLSCGNCLYVYGEQCHHVTGQCPRGCVNGFQGDLCNEENDQSVSTSEASQLSAPLYTFVTLFCISVLIIAFLVLRALRKNLPKCQRKQTHKNNGILSSSKTSDIIHSGDNCAYDEVGEVTKNHVYEELN